MRLAHILVIVCALAAFRLAEALNYCQKKFCAGGQHIACTNKKGNFSSICSSNARIESMTTSLRQVILNEHNLLRNKIAMGGFAMGGFDVYKAATRMATLRWDPELAKLAVLNVKQCTLKRENCRNSVKYQYSQNYMVHGWTDKGRPLPVVAREIVNFWFEDYELASMDFMNKYGKPENEMFFENFSNMIQDKVTHVGCGILRQSREGQEELYMTCNYSRSNVIGKPVYASGLTAASKCKTGVNPNYKFLCSLKEKYE